MTTSPKSPIFIRQSPTISQHVGFVKGCSRVRDRVGLQRRKKCARSQKVHRAPVPQSLMIVLPTSFVACFLADVAKMCTLRVSIELAQEAWCASPVHCLSVSHRPVLAQDANLRLDDGNGWRRPPSKDGDSQDSDVRGLSLCVWISRLDRPNNKQCRLDASMSSFSTLRVLSAFLSDLAKVIFMF